MATTTTPVAVGEKTAADWGNRVYNDLQALGITRAQSGTVGITITAGATFNTATVTFPTAFAASPTVSMTVQSAAGSAIGSTVLVTALSLTAFTIRLSLTGAAASTFTPVVHWIALD